MSCLHHATRLLLLPLIAAAIPLAVAAQEIDAQKDRDLHRQARAFVAATRELQKAAKTALGAGAGRTPLIDDCAQLALAAERFEKSLQTNGDRKRRQTDFANVDVVWSRIVLGVELLKPAENVTLLKSAFQADRIHQKLYRVLEIKNKRPGLTVQS